MSAPLHRIIEGLKHLSRIDPKTLVRAKTVAREQEARFLLDSVKDAIEILERPDVYELIEEN